VNALACSGAARPSPRGPRLARVAHDLRRHRRGGRPRADHDQQLHPRAGLGDGIAGGVDPLDRRRKRDRALAHGLRLRSHRRVGAALSQVGAACPARPARLGSRLDRCQP
jgi:hypothetical protein